MLSPNLLETAAIVLLLIGHNALTLSDDYLLCIDGDPVSFQASPELGYVMLSEMASIQGPLGLGIERDIFWDVVPMSEVMA